MSAAISGLSNGLSVKSGVNDEKADLYYCYFYARGHIHWVLCIDDAGTAKRNI